MAYPGRNLLPNEIIVLPVPETSTEYVVKVLRDQLIYTHSYPYKIGLIIYT
jgi:hypothetical protein